MNISEITGNSALVVAHPDDEILWFSSAVMNIDHIIFCYLEVHDKPAFTEARKRVLRDSPLKQVTALGIEEAGVFGLANWTNPKPTATGLELRSTDDGLQRASVYERNYSLLRKRLRQVLSGYRNVVTHNPWGEYGHEEHVQVFRVVESLKQEMGFELWFTNYCSNKNFSYMLKHLPALDSRHGIFATDKDLAARLKGLYRANGCWTWYDDYQWPDNETFIALPGPHERSDRKGAVIPLNLVSIEWAADDRGRSKWHTLGHRLLGKLKRRLDAPDIE
jgi:LmbE family N-acetylglucosaminyl deacetylase